MIFLDNASTSKVDASLKQIIDKYNYDVFFNPSAPYAKAYEIKKKIDNAKERILTELHASSNSKFIFTSSATESNNTVLLGQLNKRFKKVIISVGEHSSVFSTINEIEKRGFEVVTVKLNSIGQIDIDDFIEKCDENVGLISVIHVSNETGAINPIKELVKIAKRVNPYCLFHADGVQAFGKINVNVSDLGVDFYTISGHKVHCPKGIAGLYVKNDLKPYIIGGGQEKGLRSGTENVAGIMCMASICDKFDIKANEQYVAKLRDRMVQIITDCEGIFVNSFKDNSPYILSVSFDGINGETIVHNLEDFDILVGTGSACASTKMGNRTLESMGVNQSLIKGSMRISFDISNTMEEIEFASNKIVETYTNLKKKLKG